MKEFIINEEQVRALVNLLLQGSYKNVNVQEVNMHLHMLDKLEKLENGTEEETEEKK